jgi:hypothetical protein
MASLKFKAARRRRLFFVAAEGEPAQIWPNSVGSLFSFDVGSAVVAAAVGGHL